MFSGELTFGYVFDKCIKNLPFLFEPIVDDLLAHRPPVAVNNHGANLVEMILRAETGHMRLAKYIEVHCSQEEG